MKYRFEAWEDDEGIKWQREKGLLGNNPILLHVIDADTPEEAKAVHHIKMGWEPYNPAGKPQLCPKGCGSYYYPEGSGVCPKCGEVR